MRFNQFIKWEQQQRYCSIRAWYASHIRDTCFYVHMFCKLIWKCSVNCECLWHSPNTHSPLGMVDQISNKLLKQFIFFYVHCTFNSIKFNANKCLCMCALLLFKTYFFWQYLRYIIEISNSRRNSPYILVHLFRLKNRIIAHCVRIRMLNFNEISSYLNWVWHKFFLLLFFSKRNEWFEYMYSFSHEEVMAETWFAHLYFQMLSNME